MRCAPCASGPAEPPCPRPPPPPPPGRPRVSSCHSGFGGCRSHSRTTDGCAQARRTQQPYVSITAAKAAQLGWLAGRACLGTAPRSAHFSPVLLPSMQSIHTLTTLVTRLTAGPPWSRAHPCRHTLPPCSVPAPKPCPRALGGRHASGTWPSSSRGTWRWCGGLRKHAQQTELAMMSSPSAKGAGTTAGQGSPAAGSRLPFMPPAGAAGALRQKPGARAGYPAVLGCRASFGRVDIQVE